MSDTVEAFEGARVAVLTAPDLFRLDAVITPDSVRVIVRNMSGLPLAFRPDGYPRPVHVQGGDLGELALRPGHHQLAFTLGETEVRVVLATLRALERGTVQVTGQAIVRPRS